jgi:uncharacterized membrane protein
MEETVLVFKRRRNKSNLGIALVVLGASFAIQTVPQIYHRWEDVREVSDDAWFPIIGVAYLLLLAFAIIKGGAPPRN